MTQSKFEQEREKILTRTVAEVLRRGPDRVVTNNQGHSVPSFHARRDYGIRVDVIFIRDDGWTLGADRHLYGVAYDLWRSDWIGVMVRPETEAISVEEFLKRDEVGLLVEGQSVKLPAPEHFRKPDVEH